MGTREIVLRHGHVLLVDEADSPLVDAHTWYAHAERGTHYASTNVRLPDGRKTIVQLHRLLVPVPAGFEVDHANRNGLDNRRVNLRRSTRSQNKANRPAPANSTSGFKGVSWDKDRRTWVAYIHVDRRKRRLGAHPDAWSAAQAYNVAALEAWGEFAYLNSPQSARDGGAGCPGHAISSI